MANHLKNFDDVMRKEGTPESLRKSFQDYYGCLLNGERGFISEKDIRQCDSIEKVVDLEEYTDLGASVIKNVAVLKLNGGLGTSMGVVGAKSLLSVKNDKTFLDIVAQQILSTRETLRASIPLILMNSYRTREGSLKKIENYPDLAVGNLPLEFMQSKVPRVLAEDFSPAVWKIDPSLEWCPPGHGDLFAALAYTGLIPKLRSNKIEYLFISNIDNLAATLDLSILGWLSKYSIPFAMEVCRREESDRKGGHLAKTIEGKWILRELAQCPEESLEAFQDTSKHRYFNTNNLWLHLPSLERELERGEGALSLPMICNQKHIDPEDQESPRVFQLESAMGSAIQVFEGSRAVLVDRSRFLPVKTTSDFLNVSSDAFVLKSDGTIRGERKISTQIDLDPIYFRTAEQLFERFPYGAPSLRNCSSLSVRGDVRFGRNVICEGKVNIAIDRPLKIPDGSRLSGEVL